MDDNTFATAITEGDIEGTETTETATEATEGDATEAPELVEA